MPPPLLLDYPPPPMLASDSASSASSSSPPSPPPFRHRLRRNRSPSPTSRHVPNLFAHRPYSPSSREADIARILDPTYASPAPNSPLSKPSRMLAREVYVDRHGDLHDPDYRDFPPFGHTHMHSRQPHWDHRYTDEQDDEDDDDESHEQRRPSFELQPRRPSSTITYFPSPAYYPCEEPASFESRCLPEDEDEEAENFERAPLKEKSFYIRSRSPTKRLKAQEEKQAAEPDQVVQADSDWTPTCTQSLRRHWQAIALSFRFTLFRTKRRLRRHMTG